MKKQLITLIFIISSISVYNQEFSTTIYFADNIGNTDSIIIGYDSIATDSIDSIFNEINIIEIPRNNIFDVRIFRTVDEIFPTDTVSYHLKKQILHRENYYCWKSPVEINIICKYPPVYVSWDKISFADTCRMKSFITNIPHGCWFDCAGDLYRMYEDDGGYFTEFYGYETLFLQINTYVITEINKYQNILKIYPNPTGDYVKIESSLHNENINGVYLYNVFGSLIYQKKQLNNNECKIPLNKYENGLYFLKVDFSNQSIFKKIIKQ